MTPLATLAGEAMIASEIRERVSLTFEFLLVYSKGCSRNSRINVKTHNLARFSPPILFFPIVLRPYQPLR